MQIDATIQARMGSTRLPGKVLMPILGRPMLELQIERIKQSRLIDRVIVATSDSPADDEIEKLAKKIDCPCFRGSENDVLDRVVKTLKKFDVTYHMEFQGDNPLPDVSLIDEFIQFFTENLNKYDYVTNCLKTTYPPGCELSIYRSETLFLAEKLAGDSKLREHVGIHINQKPEFFRLFNIEAPKWCNIPHLHLEVDTREDFTLVERIYEVLYPSNPNFGLLEIVEYINNHQYLLEINKNIERRWRRYRHDIED